MRYCFRHRSCCKRYSRTFLIIAVSVLCTLYLLQLAYHYAMYSADESYLMYLQGQYKDLSHDDKKLSEVSVPYIHLATVKIDEIYNITNLQGEVEEILKQKKFLQFNEIFEPLKPSTPIRFILVEGAPGIGKSTFAEEISKRWASNPKAYNLDKFSLVIFIRLRESHNPVRLSDLLRNDPNTDMTALKLHLNRTYSRNVLWILDGYDELPEKQRQHSSLYHRLIRRDSDKLDICVDKATVLVTSRPIASVSLLDYLGQWKDKSKRLEIIGFDSKSIKKFAGHFFKGKREVLTDFNKFYESGHIMYKALMYIPLNTAIVCLIYEQSYGQKLPRQKLPFPRTNTEFYSAFTCALILRHLKYIHQFDEQSSKCERIMYLSDLEIQPNVIQVNFKKLLKTAYNGVSKDKYVLTEVKGILDNLGFMNKVSSHSDLTGMKYIYSFIHKTLQEYLAAVYIASYLDVHQALLLKRHNLFFSFYVGIANSDYDHTKVVMRAVSYPFNMLTFRCLYESSSLRRMLPQALSYKHFKKQLSKVVLSPASSFDYYILGYFIGNYNISLKMQLSFYKDITFLLEGIQSSTTPKGSIRFLFINEVPISKAEEIENALVLSRIPVNLLRGLHVRDDVCTNHTRDIIFSFPLVNRLSFHICDFGERNRDLYLNLCKLKYLKRLSISSRAPILPDLLTDLIAPGNVIQDLCLDVQFTNCLPIQTLFYPSSLRILHLKCFNVQRNCTLQLPISKILISQNKNLKKIRLDIDCPYIMEIIPSLLNTNVTSLILFSSTVYNMKPGVNFHRTLLHHLYELIRYSTTLQEVGLEFLGPDEAGDIIHAAEINLVLRKLILNTILYTERQMRHKKKWNYKLHFRFSRIFWKDCIFIDDTIS